MNLLSNLRLCLRRVAYFSSVVRSKIEGRALQFLEELIVQ